VREYILRVLSVSLFTSLCDFFLPDGKVRRFAAPMLGLAVTASILLPAISLFGDAQNADALLPVAESVVDGDVYTQGVEEAYKERIRAEIEARGGTVTEIVLGENFSVSRIVLTGAVPTSAMLYITAELEVPRSHVEIR